ncbi:MULTISPECIES: AbrB/MazE/SpoVT family DNA-binding domain-containing protein [unclassified Lysinibacillus]|uniref:AbrB/MazE/SpoVT family DNA-binding domain-containing protein n=1 Tax=unclassified Lysinibacillus TaxID=2636778 RepID=UPI0008843446|nr:MULTISPECIES: AbrB/MazE/SpoVT family DNA-binding domain-containing protein [unclassified Lysinibacillus]SCY99300.1 transcriptional pleiotropic regulator of transition state genes [Lysinibacillus sp. SG9]SDB46928.1 transcriptional pleiotropic regulator of transition state genes [Lysinibacillus sp. TC-37]SFT12609.1 transcriptional pleiotropic regulator of transition state genes [Lysinibacillus sp. SG55]
MKSTGMVRKVDELGRITLPKELRRTLGIESGDPVEIFIDGDQIILKKYKPNMACAVTGEVSDDNLVLLGGKLVLSLNEAKKLVTEIELK